MFDTHTLYSWLLRLGTSLFGGTGLSFARPDWLLLLLIPFILTLLNRWTNRPSTIFGERFLVARLMTGRPRSRLWSRLLMMASWTLLIVGIAGPRWGIGDDGGVAVGRDVVLVLDLSRSMLAADTTNPPIRWQSAVTSARGLVAELRNRGGHRVGVIGFAARPVVLVPLTTDYDHIDAVIADLDAEFPPAQVRPGTDEVPSGTRIGAAMKAAVAAHDPRFPGSQDIILLSDGDDPANDREWEAGVTAARAANIPVHGIGIGDPERDSLIRIDGVPLEYPGADGMLVPVRTRLHEDRLREIATAARGEYLPARRSVPDLAEFFRTRIEPYPSRELSDDAVPQSRDRSSWFLIAGLLLLLPAWARGR